MVSESFRSRFLCCGMSRLFRRKQGRLKRVRVVECCDAEIETADSVSLSSRPKVIVTQPAIRTPGGRQLFSLEDLADNVSRDTTRDASREQAFHELLGRQVNCENLVRELAGGQARLHERVVRLERKLGKQGIHYKRLTDLVRSDNKRLTKQITELHNKLDLYEQQLYASTTSDLFTDMPSYNSKPPINPANFNRELLESLYLLQVSSPMPNSITTLPNSFPSLPHSATTLPNSTIRNKAEVNKMQRSLADHPEVSWCAYHGDQKGFTCYLKSQKIVSAIKDYEDFLNKLKTEESKI